MNIDKKILICANKFKTAKDILSRIKMAYEMLPNWMKPRHNHLERFRNRILKPVAKSQQKPPQNLQVEAGSINCLILDEFAFLAPSIEEAFLASVFPVVSSSKESQIIIVSTPNRYE